METIYLPCHIKYFTYDERQRNRLATIDHVRPRHHPDRLKPPEHGDVLHVLSCWKCNNDRDRRELSEKPKEWFEERGGAAPLHKRSLDELESLLPRLGRPWMPRGRGWHARQRWSKIKGNQIAVIWAWFEKGTDEEENQAVIQRVA